MCPPPETGTPSAASESTRNASESIHHSDAVGPGRHWQAALWQRGGRARACGDCVVAAGVHRCRAVQRVAVSFPTAAKFETLNYGDPGSAFVDSDSEAAWPVCQ